MRSLLNTWWGLWGERGGDCGLENVAVKNRSDSEGNEHNQLEDLSGKWNGGKVYQNRIYIFLSKY